MINKTELEALLMRPDAAEYCISGEGKDILFSIDTCISRMYGFDQNNPHHCYDLFEHTVRTVEALDCDGLTEDEMRLLKTAALFHDVGKPDTVRKKEDRSVFYGHAKASAEIAEPILKELGYDDGETARILFYIKNHDMFISFVLPTEKYDKSSPHLCAVGKRSVHRAMKTAAKKEPEMNLCSRDFLLLLRLCEADAQAQSLNVFGDDGEIRDSREHKLEKLRLIKQKIEE